MSHEDLGFLSGMYIKNKAVTHSCNCSPEEVETGWALRLTSQTTWANDMPWVLVNDPVSISTYWHLCAHPCTLVHAHMLGHVYTPPTHTHLLPKHTWGNNYTMSRRFWKNWMSHVLATSSWWHGSSSMWHLSCHSLVVTAVGEAGESHGVSLRCSMEKHC